MNYVKAAFVVPGGSSGNVKAIAITKECCPANTNLTIDTLICGRENASEIFLADLVSCAGGACINGNPVADPNNSNLLFDQCAGKVEVDDLSLPACGTFTLSNNGIGDANPCGAFTITLNIDYAPKPEAKIFAIQPSCVDGMAQSDGYLQISQITSSRFFNWSEGSTYTGSAAAADAMDTTGMSFPIQFATGRANPMVATQEYTVRVFSDTTACGEHCYTDYTVSMKQQDCSVGCDCEEYLYLNDVSIDAVHKFIVDPSGVLTEIGSPWIPNETINNPHGLAVDLNGNLFIGQANNFNNNVPNGPIFKLDCDGNILDTDILNPVVEYGYNFFSKDGILYTFDNNSNEVKAYDLCDGSYIGAMNFVPSAPFGVNWGMYIDSTNWYLSDYGNDRIMTGSLDIDLYTDPATNSGSVLFPLDAANSRPLGITRDVNGNFFVVDGNPGNPQEISIFKYRADGTFVTSVTDNSYTAPPNTANGQDGFYGGRGIAYSADANLLYFGSFENCITVFDTNLVQQTALNIGNPEPTAPKGIVITEECCPTNNNITIDTTLCKASLSDTIFLQELINCSGSICEGLWVPDGSNMGLTYNSCNNSVTITALDACGSFTLESDGTGNNPQCGAFKIEVNISVNLVTASVIAVDQTICVGDDPAAFTISNSATGGTLSHQWQRSTTDCNSGFADILGATTDTFDETDTLTTTTYYRVIVNSANAGCNSGMCADTSNCITITVHPSPSIAARDTSICEGQPIDLSTLVEGTPLNTLEYGTDFSYGGTNMVNPLVTTTYYIRDSNTATMCVDTALILVQVDSCDWGDLPDTSAMVGAGDYQTLDATGGPVHVIIPGLNLGNIVDGETNGQPSSNALGDNDNTTNDENGLIIYETLDIALGTTFRLPLSYVNTTGSPAHIEAWIDWNNNGEFDTGEMVFDVTDPSSGLYDQLEVNVPSDAVTGEFLGLRIRISNQDNMTPYGLISEGEVEDYLIGIECATQICVPIEITIKK